MAEKVPGGIGSGASSRPGAVPILNGPPSASELPTDNDSGEPTGLFFIDTTDNVCKLAAPDGTGGVAVEIIVDLSASISLGSGDNTGLL